MNNTILITGANGTIGTQLVKTLQSRQVAFEVMSSKAQAVAGKVPRAASFEDVESLVAAFTGVNTLFVLLPLVPNKLQLANNVAIAAKRAGVQHIVRASGAGADPKAAFALPRLQGLIDETFAATGIPCTFLRNAGFMQNYTTFGAQMVRDGMWYAASNDAAQSLIDVRDIAEAAANILVAPGAHAGKAYTLTGGESLTDSARVAILSASIGKPVGFTAIPIDYAEKAMRDEWKMPPALVEWMTSLNRIVTAGYAAGISPDTRQLLGRAPTTFEQFAKDYVAAWR
jgi:uncharacterized protein YbjT (DUF2867 family)